MKLNTLLDIQSAIPVLIDITGAHCGDRCWIVSEPGCFIVDRGCRLPAFIARLAYFVLTNQLNCRFLANPRKIEKLDETVDQIRDRFGDSSLRRGSQLLETPVQLVFHPET